MYMISSKFTEIKDKKTFFFLVKSYIPSVYVQENRKR
uniref:Uncharacterized protein n=1 Tax=Lepeophtheirus salmonis TaxID=72036 RepID=A0A0K2TLD6_LEPSM